VSRVGNAASASGDGGVGAATSGSRLGRVGVVGRLVSWLVGRLVSRLVGRVAAWVASGSRSVGDRDWVAALSDGVCYHLALVARCRLNDNGNSNSGLSSGALSGIGGVSGDRSDDRRLRGDWRLRSDDRRLRSDRRLRNGGWVDNGSGSVGGGVVGGSEVGRVDG